MIPSPVQRDFLDELFEHRVDLRHQSGGDLARDLAAQGFLAAGAVEAGGEAGHLGRGAGGAVGISADGIRVVITWRTNERIRGAIV